MDLQDFNSGKFVKQIEYKSFSPEKIRHEWIISSPEINKLLAVLLLHTIHKFNINKSFGKFHK